MWPDAGGWEDDAGEEDDNIFGEVLKRMMEAEDGDEITVPDCDSPGITLGDAENGFNMLNRYAMHWNVRHRWSEGSRFAFNCYHHFLILVVRNHDGHTASFLDGQEGVSQGDPLSMLLYGVALLPLVERVNEAYPGALIPWFANDMAFTGSASNCAGGFNLTSELGPQYGYFPVADKSYHVCKLEHEAEAKVAFAEFGLEVKFSRGHRYLGGFIGSASDMHKWMSAAVEVWTEAVKTLAKIAM